MNGHFQWLMISQRLSVTIYGGEMDINWAMIPSFLKTLKIYYESEDFRTVNLSLIDPDCALQSLAIMVRDGFIHLPNKPFPETLNTLVLSRRSDGNSTADVTDYEALQNVGRYIDNLTIHENGRSLSWHTLNTMLVFRRINKLRHENISQIEQDDSTLIKLVGASLTLLSIGVIVLCLVWVARIDPSR